MKAVYKTLLSLITISIPCFTSASPSLNHITCPPLSTVSEAKFKHAARLDGGWFLIAEMYHHSQLWRVIFTFDVENNETTRQALKRGQLLFNTKVILSKPRMDIDTGKVLCYYASYNPYTVLSEVAYT